MPSLSVCQDFSRPKGCKSLKDVTYLLSHRLNIFLHSDTPELWGPGGLKNPLFPAVYNVHRVGDALRTAGFAEVQPIKFASTPIGELENSGFEDVTVVDVFVVVLYSQV